MFKLIVSDSLCVCPTVKFYRRSSYWTDLHEISYCYILRNSVEKYQIWLKLGKYISNFTIRFDLPLLVPAVVNGNRSAFFDTYSIWLLA